MAFGLFIFIFSYAGSADKGFFKLNTIPNKILHTDRIVLHAVHPGPDHVFITDKHTFPLPYKFG